jgi:4-amino-4-deoxy-L-arabinose transferase-like glycosyltransferase
MERSAAPAGLTTDRMRWPIAALIILLFAITNLPWQLDDYDQAKQAYTSWEMVGQGHWLYQHTPNEGIATKPPLVGWISAALFELTRWWEGAWRIPSFLAALAIWWLLAREASAAYGALAGVAAASAFGLNLLAPRLATLARTDMPLALVTFVVGLQIWQKIRSEERWTSRDRTIAFTGLTIALMIKGPIIYAFVLPGLVTYQILRRRNAAPSAWSGWWPWLLSLAIFLLWVIGGIVRQPGFYESVVVREFAARFAETIHRPQPIYFYLPHLLHKFAPWSVLMIALPIVFWRRPDRPRVPMQRATLWLVCWSLGGLLLMSVIPSKRVDRIFPVIPPLCLLLGAQIAAAKNAEWARQRLGCWLAAALIFAGLFTGGYALGKIVSGYRGNSDALVRFGREVRREVSNQHYAVVGGREEGMLLYLRRDHFLLPEVAMEQWRNGQLDALVVRNEPPRPWLEMLPGANVQLVSERSSSAPQYSLFVRERSR